MISIKNRPSGNYVYSLQKYTTISSRHTCPQCGRLHCFTLYVDEVGNPISELVGRCDHESSCGYHYAPHEWFSAHPEDSRTKTISFDTSKRRVDVVKKTLVHYLPLELVERHSGRENALKSYLSRLFPASDVENVFEMYFVGGTDKGETVFPQLDEQMRCRSGKIIAYDDSGHRKKAVNNGIDAINWLHSKWIKDEGMTLTDGYHLKQCLFGQHLLSITHKSHPICLVESEKTALICAMSMPNFLWLATGGKQNFKSEMLSPLTGRKICVFEDADVYRSGEWRKRAKQLTGLRFNFHEWVNNEPEDSKRDIADKIIEEREKMLFAPTQTGYMIPHELRSMALKNPAFGELCKGLQLRLVV